jgi:23S rRNA (uracil1939-C5)-methyltransferase
MQVHDKFEIIIDDVSEEGDGIGRHDNLIVFVEGGIPGDHLSVVCTEHKKNYAKGRIIKLLTPSVDRIKPECPLAFTCGGCSVMHMDYAAQLKFKEKKVEEALRRIGGFSDLVIDSIIGMEEPFRYRNKGLYPIREIRNQVVIGFYKKGSHTLIDVEDCLLQHSGHSKIIKAVKHFVEENDLTCYNDKSEEGFVRHLLIRNNDKGEYMVVLVVTSKHLPDAHGLVQGLIQTGLDIKSIYINIHKEKGNKALGKKTLRLYGENTIKQELGGITYDISPLSFFQVNTEQTKVLYDKVREFAALKDTESAFDLYSGLGSISLLLAKDAKWVYGNEVMTDAIRDANANAENNGIKNVSFHEGPAEVVFPRLVSDGHKADVVVVDPPRKGCEKEVLDTLLALSPERIIYVSCKPSTLARDLKVLCEKDYQIVKVQPVDLFPHSMHVEAIVKLEKR